MLVDDQGFSAVASAEETVIYSRGNMVANHVWNVGTPCLGELQQM